MGDRQATAGWLWGLAVSGVPRERSASLHRTEAPHVGCDDEAGAGSHGTRAHPARGAVTNPTSFVAAELMHVIYLERKTFKAHKLFP